jgi:hypothetical protein
LDMFVRHFGDNVCVARHGRRSIRSPAAMTSSPNVLNDSHNDVLYLSILSRCTPSRSSITTGRWLHRLSEPPSWEKLSQRSQTDSCTWVVW